MKIQDNSNIDPSILELLRKDPKVYLSAFCKIKTKKMGVGLQPFVLNDAQLDLFNNLDKYNRVIVLKSRQLGISTAVCGYIYHKVIMQPGTNAVIIGYERDATAVLLETMKIFWESTPKEFRPTLRINNKYEMVFPKLKSSITVLPSTSRAGRGKTVHLLLATELAFWDNAEETFTALSQSVPDDGKIIIESTPNGVGNLYHKMWINPNNGYEKLKYGWEWGYTHEQIERKRAEIGERKFAQEYGMDFLSSGSLVFGADDIKMQEANVIPVKETFEWRNLRIYVPPRLGGRYIMGVDTAEGIRNADYSAAVIIDRDSGEEVAMYKGYMPTDEFARMLNEWGRKYNNALMIVESNNHGLSVLTELRNAGYPMLYFQRQYGTRTVDFTNRLGWKTTTRTKRILIDNLDKALRDGDVIIHSKEIIDELLTFEYKETGVVAIAGAAQGYHDDLVMALALALEGYKEMLPSDEYLKLGQIDESKHVIL